MVIRLLLVSAPSWAVIKELQEITRKAPKDTLHQGLVLRPICVPEKLGLKKRY